MPPFVAKENLVMMLTILVLSRFLLSRELLSNSSIFFREALTSLLGGSEKARVFDFLFGLPLVTAWIKLLGLVV